MAPPSNIFVTQMSSTNQKLFQIFIGYLLLHKRKQALFLRHEGKSLAYAKVNLAIGRRMDMNAMIQEKP